MKNLTFISALALIATIIFLFSRRPDPDLPITTEALQKKEDTSAQEHPHYRTGKKSPDGTGKFYCGREIMKPPSQPLIADPEIRAASDAAIIKQLQLKGTEVIVNFSTTSGAYTFPLASAHPKARVIEVNPKEEMLGYLEQQITLTNTKNIITPPGKIDDIDLPSGSLDAVLMVDSYLELQHPYEMMNSVVNSLRPGALVYLVFHTRQGIGKYGPASQLISEAQAQDEMALVGLEWIDSKQCTFARQLYVFRKP